jgi:hypothetical protein
MDGARGMVTIDQANPVLVVVLVKNLLEGEVAIKLGVHALEKALRRSVSNVTLIFD